MPIFDSACILCGAAVVDVPSDDGLEGDHPSPPEWMGDFRAVYTELHQWHHARLSGVGQRTRTEDLIPIDGTMEADYSECIIGNDWVMVGLGRSDYETWPPPPPILPIPSWGFPIHESCWKILSSVFSGSGIGSDAKSIQALFDLCRSQSNYRNTLNWGHDYGVVVVGSFVKENPSAGEDVQFDLHRLVDECYAYCQYDPCSIPELTALVSDAVQNNRHSQHSHHALAGHFSAKPNQTSLQDPFYILPEEIKVYILRRLSSRDVVNLRKSSRCFASSPLTDGFWRSRFQRGCEFDYTLFEKDCTRLRGRWEYLYQKVKWLQYLPSMKNRKRIWRLAESLTQLVVWRLSHPICYGRAYPSFFENSNEFADKVVWWTASGKLNGPKSIPLDGATTLMERGLDLDGHEVSFHVSTVKVNEKNYVSGLRVERSGLERKGESIGYTQSQDETAICWRGNSSVEAVITGAHLTIDAHGIRGISLLSSTGELSNWIGDVDAVPIRRLVVSRPHGVTGSVVRRLKCGFDALKVVSFSVSAGTSDDGMEPQAITDGQPSDFRETMLWYPSLPNVDLSIVGVRAKDNGILKSHIPFTWTLFGGSTGQYLNSLTNITVCFRKSRDALSQDDLLWGIRFNYNSEVTNHDKHIHFGMGQETNEKSLLLEYSVTLDLRAGETLANIDVLRDNTVTISGLRFRTTFGKTTEIPPLAFVDETEGGGAVETVSPQKSSGVLVGVFGQVTREWGIQNLGGLIYGDES